MQNIYLWIVCSESIIAYMFGELQEVNEKIRTFVLILRIRGLGKELQGNINIYYKNYFFGVFLAKA